MIKHKLLTVSAVAVLFFTASSTSSPIHSRLASEKMKPEEIVAKHLQSLGGPEALDPARSPSNNRNGHGCAKSRWARPTLGERQTCFARPEEARLA